MEGEGKWRLRRGEWEGREGGKSDGWRRRVLQSWMTNKGHIDYYPPVQLCLFRASVLAPWLSNTSVHLTLLRLTARCRGDLPRGSTSSWSC